MREIDIAYPGLARARMLYENRFRNAEQFSNQGKKVIGYYCCFSPAEIITAANFIPYRIMGNLHEPVTRGAIYLDANMCPFLRSSFDLAVKGNYDFLDGVVVPNACRNMRRFHIFWKDHVKPAYIHYLNLPHTVLPASLDFFTAELAEFKRSLEEFAGVEISDERLNEVIELYNKNRALLRELSELRKPNPPLLSAVEMLETVIGGMTIPADEATELYKSVIKDVIERRRNPEKRPRLLVYGSAIDNTDFFRLIEDCGADVVIDDLCFGTRAYWHELETGRNPLAALSSYYLSKIMCPRTYRDSLEDRFGHIKRFADEFKVDGVILYAVRFCDSVELEIPVLRDYLQQAGLPVLYIEEDYIMSGIHILRTKVQAFVEMIQ